MSPRRNHRPHGRTYRPEPEPDASTFDQLTSALVEDGKCDPLILGENRRHIRLDDDQ
jgi:hypothetical protein